MSEAALIGVVQTIATLFVFIAVESRGLKYRAKGPQRRMMLATLNVLGLGLMMTGLGHALFALTFESVETMPDTRVDAVKLSVVVSIIMATVSLFRLMFSQVFKAMEGYDDGSDQNASGKGV